MESKLVLPPPLAGEDEQNNIETPQSMRSAPMRTRDLSSRSSSPSRRNAQSRRSRNGSHAGKRSTSGGSPRPSQHDDNNHVLIDRFIEQLSSYSTADMPNPLDNDDNVSFSSTYNNIKREFSSALPSMQFQQQFSSLSERARKNYQGSMGKLR